MEKQDGPLQKMVIKPGERQDVQLQGVKAGDIKLQLLVSDTLNRRMEPYLLTLRKGGKVEGHFFDHRGDEFAYVMEGELEAEIQGEKKIIRQGDGIYIGPTAPTKWANVGKGEVILLLVLSPPREGW
jgi:quercetin dioxygenase-like cupin family protein